MSDKKKILTLNSFGEKDTKDNHRGVSAGEIFTSNKNLKNDRRTDNNPQNNVLDRDKSPSQSFIFNRQFKGYSNRQQFDKPIKKEDTSENKIVQHGKVVETFERSIDSRLGENRGDRNNINNRGENRSQGNFENRSFENRRLDNRNFYNRGFTDRNQENKDQDKNGVRGNFSNANSGYRRGFNFSNNGQNFLQNQRQSPGQNNREEGNNNRGNFHGHNYNYGPMKQYHEQTTTDIALGFSLNVKKNINDNQGYVRRFRNHSEGNFRQFDKNSKNFNSFKKNNDNLKKDTIYHKFIFENKDITLEELAKSIHVKEKEISRYLYKNGIKTKSNTILDIDIVQLVIEHFGHEFELSTEKTAIDFANEENLKFEQKEKSPVVTIIGHVDHGKTSLIDALNKTSITNKEQGGITQHLGFYSVNHDGKEITFIDTPGHAAFEKIRKNGSNICDIVLLIIAADDGIKPQTIQAIEFIKNTNSKLIVVFNKIDKGQANIQKIKNDLLTHNVLLEDFGGDIRSIGISATKGTNLNELLDLIILEAEMLELKARFDGKASGIVLESKCDKFMGTLINILIKEGTLKVGDFIVSGDAYGKIRTILNSHGENIKLATPSQAVTITGINKACNSGDMIIAVNTEDDAKTLAEKFSENKKIQNQEKLSKANFLDKFKQKDKKILNIICKTDTQGSSDAIEFLVKELRNDEGEVNILYKEVGNINQTDINNAKMNNAIIYGFNTDFVSKNLINLTRDLKVSFKTFNVIYEMIEDIKKEFYEIFDPIVKEIYDGQLEVRQLFKISKIGLVIGCIIRDGKLSTSSLLRLKNKKGEITANFSISSLKREKNTVKEVGSGLECGFSVNEKEVNLNPGDIMEIYHTEKEPRFKL